MASSRGSLLLGLILAVGVAAAQQDRVTHSGIVQVISEPSYATPMDVPYEGEITEHTYVLHIDGRRDQFVILDPGQASLEGLRTGQYVTVTGSTTTVSVSDEPTAEETATLLTVEAIDTKPAGGNRKLAQTGTPITANGPLSALAVRVSVCGSAPSYSLSDIRASIFPIGTPADLYSGGSNLVHTDRYTYQDAYHQCSYNKGTINTASAFLYTDTVDVCNNGTGWNLCANTALPAVAAAVEQQMLNRGLNPRNYDRFIMYLPTPANCGVVGWGTVGCTHGTSCSVWIYKTSVSLALHETSHNFGLNHANAYGSYVNGQWQNDEYGDRSGAMALMQFTCFNAPNAWRLGWLLPFATLNGGSLNSGSPVRFDVPVQLSSDRSFVLINLDWITPTTNFFISYRRQIGVYDQLQPLVYLHTAACTPTSIPRSSTDCMTNNTAMLAAGGLWVDTRLGSQLRVTVLSINTTYASVQVCRSSGPCSGEPQRFIASATRWYGYPSYRFFQGATPVGFWDDSSLYSTYGTITQITGFIRTVPSGTGDMALIVGLQVSYGGVPSDVRGDSSPDLQRSYFTLLNGETITSATVRAGSGYFFLLTFTTSNGRTGTIGSCNSAQCQSLANASVVPPDYASTNGYLAAFMGASNRYGNTDDLSFLVDLSFWWTGLTAGASASVNVPNAGVVTGSPVTLPDLTPPAVVTVNKRSPPRDSPPAAPYHLLTGSTFTFDSPRGSAVTDESALFTSNGTLTRVDFITIASSDMTGAPTIVGLQFTYGNRTGTLWGQAAGGTNTLTTFTLAANEYITQVVIHNADARSFGNSFDWIEGMLFTTNTGRVQGFGCVANGQNQCSSSTSSTSSPPAGHPNAIVGAFFGQALRTTSGWVINYLGFVWADNQ